MNLKKLQIIDKNTMFNWIFKAIVESARQNPTNCQFRLADKPTDEEEAITMGVKKDEKDNNKIYYSFMATVLAKKEDSGKVYAKEIVAYTDEYFRYYCNHFKPQTKIKFINFILEGIRFYQVRNKIKAMVKKSFLHESRHVEQFNYILTHGLDIFHFIKEGNENKYDDLMLEKDAKRYSEGVKIPIETLFTNMELNKDKK